MRSFGVQAIPAINLQFRSNKKVGLTYFGGTYHQLYEIAPSSQVWNAQYRSLDPADDSVVGVKSCLYAIRWLTTKVKYAVAREDPGEMIAFAKHKTNCNFSSINRKRWFRLRKSK